MPHAPASTWVSHLESIADLIDLGHDGTGNEPLTILDDDVVGLIQDVDWRDIAGYLRQLEGAPARIYTVAEMADGEAVPVDVLAFRSRDAAIDRMKRIVRDVAHDIAEDLEAGETVVADNWCFLIDQLPDDGGTVVFGKDDMSLTLAVAEVEG